MAISVACDLKLIVMCLVLSRFSSATISASEQEQLSTVKPVRLAHTCIRFCSGDSNEDDLSPVIMLHGILDSRETWRYIYQDVARETHREVCILDARNHGDSPGSDDFDYDIMLEDVNFFLEEKNISKAIFVGQHMGGAVAMQLALTRPEKVEKIVIEDTTTQKVRETLMKIDEEVHIMKESLAAIPEGADLQTAKTALGVYFREHQYVVFIEDFHTEKEVQTLPLELENGVFKWKLNFDGILAGFNRSEQLMKPYSGIYNGDALFIYGKSSPVKVYDAKDLILNFFPKAQFVGVEGAFHWIHTRYPQFLTELLKFIKTDEEI